MDLKGTALDVQKLAGLAMTDPGAVRQVGQITDPRARAEAVASQLEQVFMQMMVKAMRATVPEGGVMGRGLGGEMYVEMLDQHFTAGGGAFDPRFHQALVRQIMNGPDGSTDAAKALETGQSEAASAPIAVAAAHPERSEGPGRA